MKKNILSRVTCTTIFLSPLLLTGCQTFGDYFGGPVYEPDPYGRMEAPSHRHGTPSHGAPSSTANKATTRHKEVHRNNRTAVPSNAPSVHRSTSVPNVGPAAPNMAPSATDSSIPSSRNNTVVPAAPTINGPAPTIAAPTVNSGN